MLPSLKTNRQATLSQFYWLEMDSSSTADPIVKCNSPVTSISRSRIQIRHKPTGKRVGILLPSTNTRFPMEMQGQWTLSWIRSLSVRRKSMHTPTWISLIKEGSRAMPSIQIWTSMRTGRKSSQRFIWIRCRIKWPQLRAGRGSGTVAASPTPI